MFSMALKNSNVSSKETFQEFEVRLFWIDVDLNIINN